MRSLASRDVLGRPLRKAQARLGGTAVVLIYHRVSDRESDPQLQCVSPAHFEQQMAIVAEQCSPLSIAQLSEHLAQHKTFPRNAVAVTFDDGYADNYEYARPVLEHYGIPATIFVNSSLVDSGQRGWVDETERIILRAGRLPETLRFRLGNEVMELPLGDSASRPSDPTWDITKPPQTAREQAYLAVVSELRSADASTRVDVLAQLSEQTEGVPDDFEADRVMTSAEIAALASGGLLAIGAHTQHHRLLAAASADEQRMEIVGDKETLERLVDGPVAQFSYPYGGRADYTDETVRLVDEAGFRCACANHFGVATPWTDRLRIPRISPVGLDGDQFAEALSHWRASGK